MDCAYLFNIFNIANVDISRYPDGSTVHYSGIDAFDYYYGFWAYWCSSVTAWFADYSWQVRTSFMLILASICAMLTVAFLFIRNIKRNRKYEKELKEARERLREPFYNILIDIDEPTPDSVEIQCNMTIEEMRRISPKVMATMISSMRMELSELTFLPNIQLLCDLTGVTQYYEANLINKKDVLGTLQNLANMNLRVSEGLLAIYINHHNNNIRLMARMCYMICTETEPYRYLEEDLQERQALWRPMMLHRLFGWLRDTGRQMPQFLVLASVIKDDATAAFVIEELAYWGNEKEKAMIKDFFLSPMLKCRESALYAVAMLGDESQEQAIIDSYDKQPENLRRSCLKAIHAINSGRYTQFFVDAFRNTSSKETKECALTCLYSYGTDGRRIFEMMHVELSADPQSTNLLNQIDSMALLQQMRMF